MKLLVGINKIIIDEKDKLNAGEYNIHEVEFEFDSAYDGLSKRAVFSNGKHNYLVELNNSHAVIPYEVLGETGDIQIGAYGYSVNGTDLELRYSPSPVYVHIDLGSYKDSYDNYKQPTADIVEQLVARIEEAEEEVNEALENIQEYDDRITANEGNIESLEETKVDKEINKGLSTNDYTNEEKTKLANLENYDDTQIKADITSLQTNKADKSEIPDVSSFITKEVNNLTNYTLKTNTGSLIDLEVNSSTYVVTLQLKDIDGNVISTDNIDLPLESVVVSGSFDSTNKKIVLTLQNGNTVDIPVGDLVAGLQTEITSNNKLASDLVDDTNSGNKFVTTSEKTTWNNKIDASALTNYVTNTDYANDSTAGVIKSRGNYAFMVDAVGRPYVPTRSYSEYSNISDASFIGKGTLENVLNARIGDIATVLDTIQGEVI